MSSLQVPQFYTPFEVQVPNYHEVSPYLVNSQFLGVPVASKVHLQVIRLHMDSWQPGSQVATFHYVHNVKFGPPEAPCKVVKLWLEGKQGFDGEKVFALLETEQRKRHSITLSPFPFGQDGKPDISGSMLDTEFHRRLLAVMFANGNSIFTRSRQEDWIFEPLGRKPNAEEVAMALRWLSHFRILACEQYIYRPIMTKEQLLSLFGITLPEAPPGHRMAI